MKEGYHVKTKSYRERWEGRKVFIHSIEYPTTIFSQQRDVAETAHAVTGLHHSSLTMLTGNSLNANGLLFDW